MTGVNAIVGFLSRHSVPKSPMVVVVVRPRTTPRRMPLRGRFDTSTTDRALKILPPSPCQTQLVWLADLLAPKARY